jgi:hypothetical protein
MANKGDEQREIKKEDVKKPAICCFFFLPAGLKQEMENIKRVGAIPSLEVFKLVSNSLQQS